MDSMIGEENGYSTIDYDYFAGEQESTNLTSRRDQGNAYEEPRSAVKKREEKTAEGLGETQPFDKKEEGENQNLCKSTGCTKVSIITCGLLILFILLTCALALLLSFQVLKKFQTSDLNSTQVIEKQERTINYQKATIDREDQISKHEASSSALMLKKINEHAKTVDGLNESIKKQKSEINQKDEELKKLGDNSAALLKKTNDDAKTIDGLNESIKKQKSEINQKDEKLKKLGINAKAQSQKVEEQKKQIDRQVADLKKLENSSLKLSEINNEQKKTIDEKKATIDRQMADINQFKNKVSELSKKVDEQKGVIDRQGGEINRLKNNISELAPEHTSVMLTGGWTSSGITASTAIYNSVEKNWTTCKLTLPHKLASHGAAVLNNEIYILGGYADGVGNNPFNAVYKMGADNEWEEMAPMIEKRGYIPQSSLVFNSEIWVIGGWSGTTALKSVEKYNPKTNSWTKMPELVVPRASAGAAVIGGKIYISSASRGQNNSVEVYDPEKNKWEIFSTMPQEKNIHVFIANHSQLIVNGEWKMDVLDPKRKWEEMPSLQQKRSNIGAVKIADGLMVFGGAISHDQRIDSVEIFDGTKWNEGPKLPEVRGVFAYFPLTCAQERLFLKRYCS